MSDAVTEKNGAGFSRRTLLKAAIAGLGLATVPVGVSKVATDISTRMDEAAKAEQQRIKDNSLQVNISELYDNDNLSNTEAMSRLGVIVRNAFKKKGDRDLFKRVSITSVPGNGTTSQLEVKYDKAKKEFLINGSRYSEDNPDLNSLFDTEFNGVKVDQITVADIEMAWDPFVVNTASLPEDIDEAYKATGLTGERNFFFQKSNFLTISNWGAQGDKILSETYKFYKVDPRNDINTTSSPIEITEFRRKSFKFDTKKNRQYLDGSEGFAYVNPFEASDQEKFNRCIEESRKIFYDHEKKSKGK